MIVFKLVTNCAPRGVQSGRGKVQKYTRLIVQRARLRYQAADGQRSYRFKYVLSASFRPEDLTKYVDSFDELCAVVTGPRSSVFSVRIVS